MLNKKNIISKASIYFCVLAVVVVILVAKNWTRDNKVIVADVVSYYAYLPATFIFNDLKLDLMISLGISLSNFLLGNVRNAICPNPNHQIPVNKKLRRVKKPCFSSGAN